MNERPFSVEQFAALMKERGDPRTLKALEKYVIRVIHSGAFPGAFKTNPDAQTSPWHIPHDEGMEWLRDNAPFIVRAGTVLSESSEDDVASI